MLKKIYSLSLPFLLIGSSCLGMSRDLHYTNSYFDSSHIPVSNVGLAQGPLNLGLSDRAVGNMYGSVAPSYSQGLQFDNLALKQRCEAFTPRVQAEILTTSLHVYKKHTAPFSMHELIVEKTKQTKDLHISQQMRCEASARNYGAQGGQLNRGSESSSRNNSQNDGQSYKDVLDSKQLDTKILDNRQKIEHCKQAITAQENEIVAETQARLDLMPACDVVGKEIPRLEGIKKQHEDNIASCTNVIQVLKDLAKHALERMRIVSTSNSPEACEELAIRQNNLEAFGILQERNKKSLVESENSLQTTKIELETAHKHMERVKAQSCKEAKQLQKLFSELRDSGSLSKADQALLQAINRKIFDNGGFEHQAHSTLTQAAKDILVRAGISPEKFESMFAADALQKHVFEAVGDKINNLAALGTIHLDDASIMECIDAAVASCDMTLDMVAISTPSQMVAAHQLSSASHDLTNNVVQAKQENSPDSLAHAVDQLVVDIQKTLPIIAQDIQVFLEHPIATIQDIRKSCHNLTSEQKIERIAEILVTVEACITNVKVPALKVEGLRGVVNAAKAQIASIANLARSNNASNASSIEAECDAIRQSVFSRAKDITIQEAHKLGFRGEKVYGVNKFNKISGHIKLDTEWQGCMEKAKQIFDSLKNEFSGSRKLIEEVIESLEKGGQRIFYKFSDGSTIQLRDLGKSGHPKIEILDTLKNITEKITFK
ncbi:MAG: hypothetical protein P4L31_08030 [Candidatus Babeliales bacterium]|nr:hypothetical protein [Candidatus Babeliales bacterium]